MKTESIMILPSVEQALTLARHCVEVGSLGLLCGAPGVGKSVSAKHVVERATAIGIGNAFYYRAFATEGSGRGIKDLLDGMGVRNSLLPTGAPLQLVNKLAQREFRAQGLRLVLVDEADAWTTDALRGFLAVIDATKDSGHPVSAILIGGNELPRMITQHAPLLSRALRVDRVDALPLDLMLGVLREWSRVFADFAGMVKEGDKAARLLAKRIHQGTGGNLRRMSYFARLFRIEFPDAEALTAENADRVFSLMMRGETSS